MPRCNVRIPVWPAVPLAAAAAPFAAAPATKASATAPAAANMAAMAAQCLAKGFVDAHCQFALAEVDVHLRHHLWRQGHPEQDIRGHERAQKRLENLRVSQTSLVRHQGNHWVMLESLFQNRGPSRKVKHVGARVLVRKVAVHALGPGHDRLKLNLYVEPFAKLLGMDCCEGGGGGGLKIRVAALVRSRGSACVRLRPL